MSFEYKLKKNRKKRITILEKFNIWRYLYFYLIKKIIHFPACPTNMAMGIKLDIFLSGPTKKEESRRDLRIRATALSGTKTQERCFCKTSTVSRKQTTEAIQKQLPRGPWRRTVLRSVVLWSQICGARYVETVEASRHRDVCSTWGEEKPVQNWWSEDLHTHTSLVSWTTWEGQRTWLLFAAETEVLKMTNQNVVTNLIVDQHSDVTCCIHYIGCFGDVAMYT